MSVVVYDVPERWIRNEADREAVRRGYYFDEGAAGFVCDFFEQFLCHTTTHWAGKPFLLEAWQRDYLSRLFGWMRPDGRRRFRESYLEVAKKNGKSTLFSGLCLYGLIEEQGTGVYQGAVDKEQAGIVYREAAQMVDASPGLRTRLKVKRHNSTIVWPENNARLACMSADVASKDGINLSLGIIDELHRFGRNRALYDILKYAGRARRQSLLLSITTAGVDRKSLCYELHEEARRIDEGSTANLHFLGVIHAAGPDDNLDDPATWRKANPSMGTIISEADFRDDFEEAKRIPGRLNNFLRLGLNIWTTAETRWLDVKLWDACADPAGFAWWRDRPNVYAALDLSSVEDLTSLTLGVLDENDGVFQWQSLYFVPAETVAERVARDKVPYDQWIEAGHIIESPGNATDFEFIRVKLHQMRDFGIAIAAVGIDPWNAHHLASLLMQDGFDVKLIRQVPVNLNGPCKELERRLLDGTLAHDNNPVTRWCVENVATESDAMGNIHPSKRRSTEKIDGVVSGIMALGMATGWAFAVPTPGLTVLDNAPEDAALWDARMAARPATPW